jgi:signal transduction histidine kinase
MKDTTGRRRDQIRYFTLAAAIGFVGGASNWPLWYNIPFPPYANMLISAYVGVVAYAIVRHNLMDIEVVIKRTAVFAGLMAFVSGTIAAFTILGQSYFESILGWSRWMSMIPSVIVITLALRPLERWLTEATERYLFQKKYDYRQLLRTFTTEVLTVLDLQKLLEKTVEGLTKIIKLESCALLIHDNAINNYQFRAGHGLREDVPMLTASDPLVYYLRATFEPARKTGNIKQITDYKGYLSNFYQLHAEIVLPIVFSEKLIGIIVLGAKKSGEEYTQEDIDILMSLARTEAIAISNAQLFQELARTQAEAAQREKMAVIGTLAAGINHEICNPLGIARGQCEMFLLNHRDGLYKDVPEKELLDKCVTIYNKVIHEIDRATGITKRLSSFAKPSSKFAMGEVVLVQEVDEVLAILGHELRIENIEIMKRIPADLPKLLSDKKQIEEVLFNIIRNAAQAMTEKGSITVTGYEKNDRIFIEIQDTGCGIPPDKLGEIFNPFYTTKAPGKGTGLGLFIVKQVVERNKGTIAVESEVGKGTKFTLSFEAARQMAAA